MKKTCLIAGSIVLLGLICIQEGLADDGFAEGRKGSREHQLFEGRFRAGPKYAPGEIIVKFRPRVSRAAIDRVNARFGTSVFRTSRFAGFKRLRIPAGMTVAEMVEIYQAEPDVEYAEANYLVHASWLPNDEFYPYQWHLDNAEYGGIGMEAAWNTSDGSGAIIAIVDTGIAYEDHRESFWTRYEQAPDLAQTLFVAGYDFVNDDPHPNDDSSPGHGTHIAGTIAQSTNNAIGAAGVAFGAYLMPVKVLDSSGTGTHADLADGIRFAVDHGAQVINLSLGGPQSSTTLKDAVAYAYENRVTVIAAAGNEGLSIINYPAAYDQYVIAVGATQYDETLAPYSNYGPSLDLVAPGGNLGLDQNSDGYGDGVLQQTYEKGGWRRISWGYYFMDGTSMAAPHVSGVAALLIAAEVATTADQVRQTLQSTAEDLGIPGRDNTYGWGLVDATAALAAVPSPSPLPPPPPVAAFSGSPTSGEAPLTVNFADQSTGDITSWSWEFGDGGNTTSQSPSHTYTSAGDYTVTLTVMGPGGSDDETKTDYIKVKAPAAQTMHVESIKMTVARSFWMWAWVNATMLVTDGSNNPVSGATVTGDWSGAYSRRNVSGITGSDGKTTLMSSLGSGTFTFTVTNVSKSGWTYDPSKNKETSDSITP
jgi:serine protease